MGAGRGSVSLTKKVAMRYLILLLLTGCATPFLSAWDSTAKKGAVSVELPITQEPTPEQFRQAVSTIERVCTDNIRVTKEGVSASKRAGLGYYGKYTEGKPYYTWHFRCDPPHSLTVKKIPSELIWNPDYDIVQLSGLDKYHPGYILQFEKMADGSPATDWIEANTVDTEYIYNDLVKQSKEKFHHSWLAFELQGKVFRYRVFAVTELMEP